MKYLCIMAGIYLHIPFCKQACNYCNFHFSTSLKTMPDVITAMEREITLQQHYLQQQPVQTVYFGGGTPSILPVDMLMRLWSHLEKTIPNFEPIEITLEANPDNITPEYLKALKHTPINRFSIGIQSFHDADLFYMNRAHNAKEADRAVKMVQDKGWENISIDLIYGTPTMTDKGWCENIQKALQLQVPHLSSYALTVEPQTALAHAIAKGTLVEPSNAQSAVQFQMLVEALTQKGYDHYEISNFALPKQYAIHNTNYWKGAHYLGIGPSAHSFNGDTRQWNVAHNVQYGKALLQAQPEVSFTLETLSFENRVNEYLMTALRTMWGIDTQYLSQHFGNDVLLQVQTIIAKEINPDWIIIEDATIRLTAVGKLYADGIAATLFL
jgi:oxygen-independent coproporphyrinogen-3 oxidase